MSIPRSVVKVQYNAARLPFTVLEERVVVRYLDDNAPARLSYERFLGSMDETAGRVLADASLARRGQAFSRRADFIVKAEELDARADDRRTRADQELRAEQERANRERAAAANEMERRTAAARRTEANEKQQSSRQAAAQAQAGAERATQVAESQAAAAAQVLQSKRATITAAEKRAIAAPKQQLTNAADKRRAAKSSRSDAERLGQLATAEKTKRRTNRP